MKQVFELKINPNENIDVDAIALVENPAIEVDYMAFSKELKFQFSTESMHKFSLDEEKKEVFGIAMIPDLKIPRLDKKGKEFDVFFTTETIREIAKNYFQKGFHHNINIEHTSKDAKCFVFQSYIVDKSKGIDSPFPEAIDGSWIVGMKVMDDDTWEKVKNGELKGFSIEGLFQQIEQQFAKEDVSIQSLLDSNKNEVLNILNNKSNNEKMTKDLKKLFGSEFEKIKNLFAEDKSQPIEINEDEIKGDIVIGGKIERLIDEKPEPIEDGVYKIGEKELEIKDGLIAMIDGVGAEKEEPKAEEMETEPQPNDVANLQAQIESLSNDLEALKTEVETLKGNKESDEKVIEEMKSQFAQLTSVLEKFAKIPAQESQVVVSEKEKQKIEKEKNMNAFLSSFKAMKN